MEIFNPENSKSVPKGHVLLSQGELSSTAFWVEKGCLKSYVIDKTGKEHILQFAPEGWLISFMDVYPHQTHSNIFIDAIEDSKVVLLSKVEFGKLEELDKPILVEMSKKYQNNLIAKNKRIIGLLSSTAEERYVEFTETYPTLVQRLPLKLIASYIGITPEYLSEIRRKISKK